MTLERMKKLQALAERAHKRNEYLPAVWLQECLDEIERLQVVERDANKGRMRFRDDTSRGEEVIANGQRASVYCRDGCRWGPGSARSALVDSPITPELVAFALGAQAWSAESVAALIQQCVFADRMER